jgi:hypothetical protein
MELHATPSLHDFIPPRLASGVLPGSPLFVPAEAAQWTDPTPAELQMTAEPMAPGAPAVILSY